MQTSITIKNKPNANEIWEGIGGHFDSLGQIINEFLDNAVSNFIGNSTSTRSILIYLKELSQNGSVEVKIEDSGTGIKNLDAAFTLGSRSAGETPLNEHGFGLKHALASANPENNSWKIYTRTQRYDEFFKLPKFFGENLFERGLARKDEFNWYDCRIYLFSGYVSYYSSWNKGRNE